MNVSLIVNFDKKDAKSIAAGVIEQLNEKCIHLFADEKTTAALQSPDIETASDIFEIADVCVVIGGDGTILHAAKRAALLKKPVLGVNAGRIGYLASVEKNELSKLKALQRGDYKIEERTMLDVTLMSADSSTTLNAFNDAVISKGALSRMIDMELFVDRHRLRYRSDGLIISTATGSTAYSLSAGGPVMDPRVDNIVLTPICPYTYFTRTLVIPSAADMLISVDLSNNKEAYLTVDGEVALPIGGRDKIRITRSDTRVKLISLDDQSIYDCLERKIQL